jgi:multisubunit Na+/H+ antiporter MnhC subunit
MPPAPAFRLPEDEPPALHDRAMDNLQFIRDTMERAAAFTAMPGWGGVAVGVTALAATYIARQQPTLDRWMVVWFIEAAVALVLSGWAVRRKAARAGVPLLSGPGRRFALNFAPPMLVGGILTLVLYRSGLMAPIPGVWLLLYGTGIVAGGAFSVPVVPAQGVLLMLTGTIALFAPAAWRDYFMAFGFGMLQIAFGYVIARRYGG